MSTVRFKTREEWLMAGSLLLGNKVFAPLGYKLPVVRVSIGFPSFGIRSKAIGECWNAKSAKDNISQIHITPRIDEPLRILDILAHELIHAIEPEAGHGKEFKRIAVSIGLEGPMRSTTAGQKLTERLNDFIKELGPLPHCALTPSEKIGGKKKQGIRMIKCVCSECGYVARTSRQWLSDVGAPLCACNQEPMQEAV